MYRLIRCRKNFWLHLRRRGRQCLSVSTSAKPGDRLHGYVVDKVTDVPEFSLTAVQLTHEATGASHVHINRDDKNNTFGVAFRTTPMDSTGVPHILEHTVLCGSQKYPVRDPFFKMLNRSLSTFMNAFTASDWTMYPFSTQNKQDFENLLSVYLDAVFHPRLSQLDFMQEGWRLEHTDPRDPSTPLIFKGIVFNEMKGVFSNSQHHFAQKNQNFLLPTHTYGVVSGGDPACITDLTWQELKQFHTSHYHPSNARFYTYGNFPMEHHLELINKWVLSNFTRSEMNTRVPSEPRWTKKREMTIDCRPDPLAPVPEKQTTIAMSYVLTDVADIYESFVLSVLGYLLTHGEKAPFYQALLESNIGSDFSPVLGYDGNTKDSTFSVGLQGIHQNDVEKVKKIIENTFKEVVSEGFDPERIEGVLHIIELGQKHQTSKFGLNLGIAVTSISNHEGDPVEAIRISKCTQRFTEDLQNNPRFLQEKVQQYFIENSHCLTLVMSPSEDHDQRLQAQEEERLQELTSGLSQQQKDDIYKRGMELMETQMKEEDISCLPSLKVSDIDRVASTTKTESLTIGNTKLQLSEQPTNGVTYLNFVSNISHLPDELKPYVPFFTQVVTRMGAGDRDYKQLSQQVELKTGGLSASVHLTNHHTQADQFEQGILFSSYCLEKNTEDMFQLWTDIFNRLDMSDHNRLLTLIQMTASGLAHSIADSGHSYAMTCAGSSLHPSGHLRETMSGMSQVNFMRKIAEMQDPSPVLEKLQQIASKILNKDSLRLSLNATPEGMSSAVKLSERFVESLPQTNANAGSNYCSVADFTVRNEHIQHELPFQVNYVSRCVKTVPYTTVDFARLRILSRLMSAKFLHREIREKGGAYGGGATGGTPGLFQFYSYRDPNSSKTLQAFDEGISWAADGKFSQQDIDEAKLSVFSQVDSPVPPGEQGQRLFQLGIDDAMRQAHREALFAVTRQDIIDVTIRYLLPSKRVSSVALLGPENKVCKAQGWTIHKN